MRLRCVGKVLREDPNPLRRHAGTLRVRPPTRLIRRFPPLHASSILSEERAKHEPDLGFPEPARERILAKRRPALQAPSRDLRNGWRIRIRRCAPSAISPPGPASSPTSRSACAGRFEQALAARGIRQLYSHQAEALRACRSAGRNVVVVTPTASGKTLCYNLPVLNRLMADPGARAMYLFPTKALAEDQLQEFQGAVDAMGSEIRAFTYDGDTPQDARRAIRERANVVLTNPDMLHAGILPHHTKWAKAFENLRYIVIDELHYYRGVYGSHLANMLRRLKRICEFYGSSPQFICCSATIANPQGTGRSAHRTAVRTGGRKTARRRARNMSSSTIRRW